MQDRAILGVIAAAGLAACSPDDHGLSRTGASARDDEAILLTGSGSGVIFADAGPGSGSGSGSAGIPDAGTGSGSGSGSNWPPDAGGGSGSGDAGICTFGRRALDWHPAMGELDSREWSNIELTASPSNHDLYPWTFTVSGPIDQVRLAPPHYDGTPAYAFSIDYDATIDECPYASTVYAWFLPGIYTAEISYRDGRPPELFAVFAGSSYNGPITTPTIPPTSGAAGAASTGTATTRAKDTDPNCREYAEYSQIPWNMIPYDTGAFIIEDPDKDNGSIERAAKIMGTRAVRAGDVATAAQKLFDAYTTKTSAINAVIEGHGANTDQSIGAGQKTVEGKYLFMTGTQTNKDFLAKLSAGGTQRIQRLALIGCCVGGRVQELANDHLMCDMARGLAPGASITEVLAFGAVTSNVEGSWRRAGYFTVSGSAWHLHGRLIKKGHCDDWQAQKPPRR